MDEPPDSDRDTQATEQGAQPSPDAPPSPSEAAEATTAQGQSLPSDAAAQGGTPASPAAGLIAVGLLIGLVMILGLVILAVRKRMLRDDTDDRTGATLMDELREALREGRMTQEEFDAAKRVMVARLRGAPPEKSGRARS